MQVWWPFLTKEEDVKGELKQEKSKDSEKELLWLGLYNAITVGEMGHGFVLLGK